MIKQDRVNLLVPNRLWLASEFILAILLCLIPITVEGILNDQTLTQGLILAILLLVPSEVFRQFVGPVRLWQWCKNTFVSAGRTQGKEKFEDLQRELPEKPAPTKVALRRGPPLVLEPKGERMERYQVVHPPKPVSKPVRPDRTGSDHPLVSLFQPGSLGAEQFRKLRTHVLKLNLPDPPKTIMVTSATEGEGKTFVAANLAASIAQDLHFHVLLVDCDLRNPTLSQCFGVQNGRGLSDYLVGRGQLSELLMKTEMEKLSILMGGSAQQKPAELIGSRKMEALIHELKSGYNDRYIILDATPLLATSEPIVLARLVDGILIVVRAGVTPRETVKQAIASLDPKKILGFVLNDVEFKSRGLSSRYFGSDGYYAKYGYGERGAGRRSP